MRSLTRVLRTCLRDPALSLITPTACSVCQSIVESVDDGVACSACWAGTRFFCDPLCKLCGIPLPVARAGDDCGQCNQLTVDYARSLGAHGKALRASVLMLKRTPIICRRLRVCITSAIEKLELPPGALLIPVPLHAQRKRERGFNQADLLAQHMARSLKAALIEDALERSVNTSRHRVGMDAATRWASVSGSITVALPRVVRDREVLLVDDVLTSGATVSACALALKHAGAARVGVFTIARAGVREVDG